MPGSLNRTAELSDLLSGLDETYAADVARRAGLPRRFRVVERDGRCSAVGVTAPLGSSFLECVGGGWSTYGGLESLCRFLRRDARVVFEEGDLEFLLPDRSVARVRQTHAMDEAWQVELSDHGDRWTQVTGTDDPENRDAAFRGWARGALPWLPSAGH